MPAETTPDLRYPIGRYQPLETVSSSQRHRWIDTIATLPAALADAVAGLSDAQLDTPYRPDGWTVRQLVHHVADSHMNAYIRFKLALTEDGPTIKPYDEARWAELEDSTLPVQPSLAIVEAVHTRWTHLLRAMQPGDFARTFVHPEHGRVMSLDFALGMYAWHSMHHVAHVTGLRERSGW